MLNAMTHSIRNRLLAGASILVAAIGAPGAPRGKHADRAAAEPESGTATVAIVPTSATPAVGQSRHFSATVRNASDSSVVWEVSGVQGGNSTLGTITAAGIYTAPSAVPSPATVSVTAVLETNSKVSAAATVTVTVPQVAVSISPASVAVAPGG